VEAALGWLGAVIEWLGRFIPRCVIVDSTQGAIKWVNRLARLPWRASPPQEIHVLGPGRHWYWPWTTKFEEWPVARTTRDLPTQDITTSDGKIITVRGLLAFEVQDLEILVCHTEDPHDAIRDIASTALHEVLKDSTYDEVLHKNLDRKLRGAAARALHPYGIKVLELTLLSCTPARVVRLVQNSVTDGI
jgi:regulator of protease activity HflC (stomatin/prohibitin superfamily)